MRLLVTSYLHSGSRKEIGNEGRGKTSRPAPSPSHGPLSPAKCGLLKSHGLQNRPSAYRGRSIGTTAIPLPLPSAGPQMLFPHPPSWGLVLHPGSKQKGKGCDFGFSQQSSPSLTGTRPPFKIPELQPSLRFTGSLRSVGIRRLVWSLLLDKMKAHKHGDCGVVYLLSDPGTGNWSDVLKAQATVLLCTTTLISWRTSLSCPWD